MNFWLTVDMRDSRPLAGSGGGGLDWHADYTIKLRDPSDHDDEVTV